jgi:hypothetical protein
MENKKLLIESTPIRLSLVEGSGSKVIARGEFGRCDVPTSNKRVYSRAIVEKELNRLSDDVNSRRMFGELDHPADGKTKLQRVSHIITNMEIDESGAVIGEAEILDTPNGKILKAIIEAGGEVGVSSRGFGSVTPGPNGAQSVGEDFVLKTYDFVADPAMKSAYPEIFSESLQEDYDWSEGIKSEFPELVEELEKQIAEREAEKAKAAATGAVEKAISTEKERAVGDLEARFERRLAESIAVLRDDVREELSEEMGNDPDIGGAMGVLGQIAEMVATYKREPDQMAVSDALKARDLEVAEAHEETAKWQSIAKKSGYMLHVERRVGEHPLKSTVMSSIGDVSSFTSIKDLDERVSDVLDELGSIVSERDSAREEAVESDRAREVVNLEHQNSGLRNGIDELKSTVKELERKLERAVEIGEEIDSRREDVETQLHEAVESSKKMALSESKSRAVAGYTNAPKLMDLLEGVEDPDHIHNIIERHGTKTMTDSRLEDLRSRLSRGVPSDNREALVESKSGRSAGKEAISGVDFGTMRALSGIAK